MWTLLTYRLNVGRFNGRLECRKLMEPARGAPLAGEHAVLRYVGGLNFDVDKGVVDGGAFLRKPKDIDGLSLNWLEWFPGPLEDQVAGVRRAARLRYGRTTGLARLNVGQSINSVWEKHPERLTLSFVLDPLPAEDKHGADQSHSLIVGAPFRDGPEADLLGDLIAQRVVPPVCPAVLRP
jgi:hypothetical protein